MSVHNTKKLSFPVMQTLFKADAHKNSFVRAVHKGNELSPSQGTHQTYAKSDGHWQDGSPDEIKRLIGLLIYFGLVKVVGKVEKYWSKKSLYNGLWARAIMLRERFKVQVALLHVVDPATKLPGDKLRNVESLVDYFKTRCRELYQPRTEVHLKMHYAI